MGTCRRKDLIIFILLFIIVIVGVIYNTFLFFDCFQDGEEVTLSYNEQSELKYKIWLIDNEFYSSEYLSEEYNAVASSIKEIEVDFEYLLNTSGYVQGESYYTINTRIVAYQRGDSSERKIWDYEKLIKDKVITKYDIDTLNISNNDNFKIDYQLYRTLMNDYKDKYKVSLVGNLIIEIDIKTDLDYEKFENEIDLDKKTITLTVPLTENIVNITKSDDLNNSLVLMEKGEATINYKKLVLCIVAYLLGFCLCIYLGIILVKIFGVDSKYIKELKKILKTYGSVIVNVNNFNMDKKYNIMEVNSFYELLDAQQELKKPILYYNIKNNKKCLFAIKYDNDILVYKMNSNLYENNSKKEKSDVNENK